MFLFENFTYNDRWASLYYQDFYDASDVISNFLNNNYTKNGEFYAKKVYDTTHKISNQYKIFYLNKADIFDNKFPKDAYDYAINKFKKSKGIYKILGSEVQWKNNAELRYIIVEYNIDKDEMRWNSEHEKLNNIIHTDEILSNACNISLEQWVYMLNSYYEHKNPKMLFNKEKDISELINNYIIAVKLNWEEAIDILEIKISEMLVELEKSGIKVNSRIKKAIKLYAYEIYKIDSDVENLIKDFKDSAKNKTIKKLPAAMNNICKILDNNIFVDEYAFGDYYDPSEILIKINTANNNSGTILIKKMQYGTYKGMWQIILSSNNWNKKHESHFVDHFTQIEKYGINAAIIAIYKNDPKELYKIRVKI